MLGGVQANLLQGAELNKVILVKVLLPDQLVAVILEVEQLVHFDKVLELEVVLLKF